MPDDDKLKEFKEKYDMTNFIGLHGTVFALNSTEIPIHHPLQLEQ